MSNQSFRIVRDDGSESRSPEDWGKMVRHRLVSSLQDIVRAGQMLEEAVTEFKKQDGHWKHKYSDMLKSAHLSRSVASRLRSIAAHPVLGTNLYEGSLPPSKTVLGELASLPEDRILELIKSGDINPETTLTQVRKLKTNRASTHGSTPKKPTDKDAAYQAWIKEQEAAEPEMSLEELFGLVKQALKVTPLEFKQAADEDFGQSKWWAAKTLIEHEKKVLKSLAPLNKTSRKAALKAIVDILGHQELVIDHVVAVRVEHVAAQYREKYHQAADTQRQFHDLRRNLGKQAGLRGMDKKDAQVIRSALHSDRLNGISEADRKRLDNAFGIFKRYTDKEGITA